MSELAYKITADGSSLFSALSTAKANMASLASTATMATGVIAAFGVGLGAMAMGKAIRAASELETLRTAFVPLLGTFAEARTRMEELAAFSAATPFELPEIAKASKILETLTKGALSTGKGLTLVGDVAAGTGTNFEEVAVTIGRLYDGLQSGRPVGEAMARLQELGAISGDTRAKLELLQKQGVKGAEAWKVASDDMSRFSGGMELQSQTWAGKLSTLKDNISMTFAAFGEPVLDALGPLLDKTNKAASAMAVQAKGFGQSVANSIDMVRAAFQTGQVGGVISTSLKIAFAEGVNYLHALMKGAYAAAGQLIVEQFKNAVTFMEILHSKQFWYAVGNTALDAMGLVVEALKGALKMAIGNALESFRPILNAIGKGKLLDDLQGGQETGDKPEAILKKVAERWKESIANTSKSFAEGMKNSANVMDASPLKADLAKMTSEIKEQAAINKQDRTEAKAALEARLNSQVKLRNQTVATAKEALQLQGPPRPVELQGPPRPVELQGPPRPVELQGPPRPVELQGPPRPLQENVESVVAALENTRRRAPIYKLSKAESAARRLARMSNADRLKAGLKPKDAVRAALKGNAGQGAAAARSADPLTAIGTDIAAIRAQMDRIGTAPV